MPGGNKRLIYFRLMSPAHKETKQFIYKGNQLTVFYMMTALFINSFNPFHATNLFLYPLKTSENLRFSDVFRGYRKRPVA